MSDNTGIVIYDIYQRGPRPLSAKEADVLRPVVPLSLVLPGQWNGDLRWLNTVLRAVSGNLRDGACFKLD